MDGARPPEGDNRDMHYAERTHRYAENKRANVHLCEGYRTDVAPEECLPKTGKVNEMCREWLVREDGALAYQLQSQEINQHYLGNKHRNAQVREDFPCALDEQQREQQLAEQAAAVYQKMLQEQEEIDKQVARQLAKRIEKEERMKRRALELMDEDMARQLLENQLQKPKPNSMPLQPNHQSLHKPISTPARNQDHQKSPHRPDSNNYFANLPRRRALQMPIPDDYPDLYTEPYKPEKLSEDFDRIDIQEVGLPIDELTERQIQEERDAELARKLQEQLSQSEELNRDMMLAMEAQDKELAKLLQERERAKAKRAKERARQKALVKKQQQLEQEQHQIMPDDSYSSPIDLLPQRTVLHNIHHSVGDDDTNYSFPVDVLPNRSHEAGMQFPQVKQLDARFLERVNGGSSVIPSYINQHITDIGDIPPPVRPTQLDLRSPLTQKINKPRFPDPVEGSPEDQIMPNRQMPSPSKQLVNIAMAIDPTYPRRTLHSPPSYDTTSSTVTTSTSSSSPGMILPTPDIPEDDPSPVPPYMPIQGQRRTASLEKKSKKKVKDGCKQQ